MFGIDGSFTGADLIHRSYAKTTYRLSADSRERDVILQVWLLDEAARAHAFRERFGLTLECVYRLWPFGTRHVIANTAFLRAHGINVPAVLFADDSQTTLPFDYVVYQQVRGRTLDRHRASLSGPALTGFDARLADTFGLFHSLTRPAAGTLIGPLEGDAACVRLCTEQIRANVDCAAADSVLKARGDELLDRLQSLTQAFRPKTDYHATHGDLQPDHLVVDDTDEIWFIDVENMKFFDVEYEICRFSLTLELASQAFEDRYYGQAGYDVDPARISYYELYWLVSWIAFLANAVAASRGGTKDASSQSKRVMEQRLEETLAALQDSDASGRWLGARTGRRQGAR